MTDLSAKLAEAMREAGGAPDTARDRFIAKLKADPASLEKLARDYFEHTSATCVLLDAKKRGGAS